MNKHIELLRKLWSWDNFLLNKRDILKHSDKLSPYEKLPNVIEFCITKLSEYHPILLEEGLKKKNVIPRYGIYKRNKSKNESIFKTYVQRIE